MDYFDGFFVTYGGLLDISDVIPVELLGLDFSLDSFDNLEFSVTLLLRLAFPPVTFVPCVLSSYSEMMSTFWIFLLTMAAASKFVCIFQLEA